MKFYVLAAILAATPAVADTFSGTSIGKGSATSQVMPLAEGTMVIKTDSAYEMFEVEDGHPLQGASGPCFGAVSVVAGSVSGGGNCVYETSNGQAIMQWTAMGMSADGALVGSWIVLGGSGGWAMASGGGSFSSLTDPQTGKFVNTIHGSITMK